MKKILTVLVLALATLTVSAQDFKKFRFGPTAGLNVAKISKTGADMRIGFNVGARVEYNFNNTYYLASGLLFTQKGLKGSSSTSTLKANPGYIEIPINFGCRYVLNNKLSIFTEAGPYLGFGICGKWKIDNISHNFFGDEGSAILEFATPYDSPKRFDFGLGFAIGAEYANFQLRVGYELGLTKVFSGGPDNPQNRNLFVGLSYMF